MSKANPVADVDPMPDAWVVHGCRTSVDFWQMCLPLPPVPKDVELAMAANQPDTGGELKVMRGFDNLLHWLDWFDSVHAGMPRGEIP